MRCGDAVLMAVPGVPSQHLWILITDPDPDTFLGAMVSVTTLRGTTDQTVILQPCDHPFVKRPSAVHFGDARLFDTRRVEEAIRAGGVHLHQRCSAALIALLQDGALASPYTPNKVLEFCCRAYGRR